MIQLSSIQQKLKAPKSNRNTFGNYNYRSCEDILEAVKPLLGECTLVISDTIEAIGGRVYVKATATISDLKGVSVSTTAYAREAEEKRGMDVAQITGAASSYARKYALNGLFAIDDTKDADATNEHDKPEPKGKQPEPINPHTELNRLIDWGNKNGFKTETALWLDRNIDKTVSDLSESECFMLIAKLKKDGETFKKDGAK